MPNSIGTTHGVFEVAGKGAVTRGTAVAPLGDSACDLLYYDGQCGLSHQVVALLARADEAGKTLRFAPVQGTTFRSRIPERQREASTDSMVVETCDGMILTRSAAWIHVLRRLGGVWGIAGAGMSLIPQVFRDWVYGLVAKSRYLFFGRRERLYPQLQAGWRDRFLG